MNSMKNIPSPLHTVVLTINKCKQMVHYIRKTGLNRKIEQKKVVIVLLKKIKQGSSHYMRR